MYFQPYGDEQQLNLNWIINEIINLHKQLDPNYETPSFTQVYPYSNLNRLNLDWVLSELKALKELAPEPTPALDIQAVAEALVALPFDSERPYQIYDFISRNGEIWRATETVEAGSDWNESQWFNTKIGTDLAVLERWINAINADLTTLQNTVEDLSSDEISDDSDAGGATVKESLNNLKGSLNTINDELQVNAFTNIPLVDNAYVSNTDGSFIPYNGWQRTDYIPVDPSKTYILLTTNGSTYSVVYNANKQFKRALTVGTPSTELTFEEGDAFIALSFVGLSNVVKIKAKTILDTTINTRFKVMSFNCGGFSYGTEQGIADAIYEEKIVNWRRFFGEQNVNIAGIQELPNYVRRTGGNDYTPNAALFKQFFNYNRQNPPYMGHYSNIPLYNIAFGTLSTGRSYTCANFKIGTTEIYFLNVHLSPSSATNRATEIGEILTMLAQHEYFVLTGDFNLASDGESVTQYKRFTDAGYSLANTGWFGSWWTWSNNQADFANYDNPSGTVWYIDNIIISSNLHFKNVYCPNSYAQLTSDHIPCVAEIDLY